MVRHSTKLKFSLLFIALVFTVSTAFSANWSIQKKASLSQDTVSPGAQTIQVMNITADVTDSTIDDPDTQLNPTGLEPSEIDQSNIYFKYNETNGTETELVHMNNGLWYASFTPTSVKGSNVLYSANGTTTVDGILDSNGTANITDTLTLGEYNVQLQNDYSNAVKAGREFEMEVVVTNVTDGSTVSDSEASVEVYFENNTESLSTQQVDNYQNGEFYNSRISYPDSPDTTYIMHVRATQDSGSAMGTTSRIVDVAPQIQGQISQFYSEDGCNNQSMVSECEQGANLDTEYEITNSNAKNVNLSVYAFNASGRHMIDTMNLSKEEGNFTGQMNMPDLNTSIYQKEVEFVFNATNNYRMHVDRHNVTLNTFKIQDRSSPTTYLGQGYDMQIFLGKPFTLNDYNKDRFTDVTVNVTDSNGQLVNSFDENDLSYSGTKGVMEASLLIDESNPTGGYGLTVTANNIYGEQKTLESGFSVRDIDATFDVESDVEWNVNRLEPINFMIEIENLLETENELEYSVEELSDQLTVTNQSITLSSLQTDKVQVRVNMTELKDEEGEIKFMDESTNYNQTVDIELDTPNCQIQTGDLCSETSSVNATASSTSSFTESIDLRYIGEQGSSVTYNTTIEGEIGQYLTVENQSEGTEIVGERDVLLTFNPQSEGYFTGQVIFENQNNEELSVPVSLNYASDDTSGSTGGTSNGEAGSITVSPTTIDLGTVVNGETASATVEVTNDGDSMINSVSIDSSSYTVSTGSAEIPAGETETIPITFEEVSSSSGTLQITASTSAGETSETVSISASPIQDYSERTSELRSRLADLQSSAGTEYQSDLTEASTQISQLETAWDAGNYEEARSTYQQVSSTLDTVEAQTSSPSTGEGTSTSENSDGGLPLIPIVGGVVVLILIAGFVFYESYIPEEGDPLYSVLGENQ